MPANHIGRRSRTHCPCSFAIALHTQPGQYTLLFRLIKQPQVREIPAGSSTRFITLTHAALRELLRARWWFSSRLMREKGCKCSNTVLPARVQLRLLLCRGKDEEKSAGWKWMRLGKFVSSFSVFSPELMVGRLFWMCHVPAGGDVSGGDYSWKLQAGSSGLEVMSLSLEFENYITSVINNNSAICYKKVRLFQ